MTQMTNADALRLAVQAKTRVMQGGIRAATTLSTDEVVAMARVLDSLFIDLDRDAPASRVKPTPTPISTL